MAVASVSVMAPLLNVLKELFSLVVAVAGAPMVGTPLTIACFHTLREVVKFSWRSSRAKSAAYPCR